ncbi:MAG: hypothetical protein IKV82_00080 [Akkermansia sp.]|nr:hypothetical protein [Akkermansia sp.]
MMWQANKWCILFLLAGFALLGVAYYLLAPGDELLARKVLSTGVCVLLAAGGVISWLSARKGE